MRILQKDKQTMTILKLFENIKQEFTKYIKYKVGIDNNWNFSNKKTPVLVIIYSVIRNSFDRLRWLVILSSFSGIFFLDRLFDYFHKLTKLQSISQNLCKPLVIYSRRSLIRIRLTPYSSKDGFLLNISGNLRNTYPEYSDKGKI